MSANRPPVRPARPDPLSAAQEISAEVEAQLNARQRRRAQERKVQRPKATFDLPLALIQAVQEIAAAESVAQSDIAAWALIEFVERYRQGDVDLDAHKRPTRSLRVDWKLALPAEWE